MRVSFAGRTSVGRKRELNEDALLLLPEQRFFAVVDGMGGNAGGERASQLACEAMRELFRAGPESPFLRPVVQQALEAAHRAIWDANRPTHYGYGATAVAVHLAGTLVSAAHVGDCRLYRRDASGAFTPLSRDHSLVNEMLDAGQLTAEAARDFPHPGVVTRALGVSAEVRVEVQSHFASPGDLLLLCSDGLHRELADPELAAQLQGVGLLDEAVRRLLAEAEARGGRDNLTAVLLRVEGGQ